jgi:hypothetical protein
MMGAGNKVATRVFEEYLMSSLATTPCDQQLHIRLVRLLLDCGELVRAINHCMEASTSDVIPMAGDWLKLASKASEMVMDIGVHQNHLPGINPLAVCLFWIWTLERKVVNAIKSRANISNILSNLTRFDEALLMCHSNVKLHGSVLVSTESKAIWKTVLAEMRGHLYEHCATVLIIHGLEHRVAWSLVRKHFFACCLASLAESPCSQEIFEKSTFTMLSGAFWHAMGCRRHCRIGYCVQSLTRQLEEKAILEIVQDVISEEGQQSLIRTVFKQRSNEIDQSRSLISNDRQFLETKLTSIDEADMAVFEQVTALSKPRDLHQLAWIGSNHMVQDVDILPDVGAWCHLLFSGLPVCAQNLAPVSWDSVTIHDVEAFLYGLFIGSAAVLKAKREPKAPPLLPMLITRDLPTAQGRNWWEALLRFSGLIPSGVCDMAQAVKHNLQFGLEAVRAIRPRSMGALLLIHLARLFSAKALELKDEDGFCGDVCESLEQRAMRYWQAGCDSLKSLKKGYSDTDVKGLVFPVSPSALQDEEIQELLLECRMELAAACVQSQNFEKALQLYDQLETPEAAWNRAQILKFLARSDAKDEKSKEVEKPSVCQLLKDAEESLNLCQSRLTDDSELELESAVVSELKEIKAQISQHADKAVSYCLDDESEDGSTDEPVETESARVEELSNQVCEMASELRQKDEMIRKLTEELKALKNEVKTIKAATSSESSQQQSKTQLSTSQLPHLCPVDMPPPGNGMAIRPMLEGSSHVQPRLTTMLLQPRQPAPALGRGYTDSAQVPPWMLAPTTAIMATSQPQTAVLHTAQTNQAFQTRPLMFTVTHPIHSVSMQRVTNTQQQTNTTFGPSGLSFFQRSNSPAVHKTSTPMMPQQPKEEPSLLKMTSPFTPTPAFKLFSSHTSKDEQQSVGHDQTVVEKSATIPWSSTVDGIGEVSQMRSDFHQTGKLEEQLLTVKDQSVEQKENSTTFGSGFSRKMDFGFLASSSTGFEFGRADSKFAFEGAGAPLFQGQTNGNDEEASYEDDKSDDGPQFKPLVQLPVVEVKTGEEDEDVMFANRCKLYRYDKDTAQWKERGTGEIKILSNPASIKCRVVMRREQVLKLCANHYITEEMDLKPHGGSDRAWVWFTAADVSDGDSKAEQLAVKFRDPSIATKFKEVFDDCRELLRSGHEHSQQGSSKVSPQQILKESKKVSTTPLSELFKPDLGTWQCSICLVQNKPGRELCADCSTPASTSQPISAVQGQNIAIESLKASNMSKQQQESEIHPAAKGGSGQASFSFGHILPADAQLHFKPTFKLSNGNATENAAVTSSTSLVSEPSKAVVLPESLTLAAPSLKDDLAVSEDSQFEDGDDKSSENWTDESGDETKEVDQSVDQSVIQDSKDIELNVSGEPDEDEDEVVFLFERLPTNEQLEKAKKYQLPPTFYLYEDRPTPKWCQSDEDDSETELETDMSYAHKDKSETSASSKSKTAEPEANVSHTDKDKLETSALDKSGAVTTTTADSPHFLGAMPNMTTIPSFSQLPSFAMPSFFQTSSPIVPTFSQLAASTASSGFTFNPSFQGSSFTSGETSYPSNGDQDDEGVLEEEADVHFDPLVKLPVITYIKSGEEGLTEVFCQRAKLYRFDKVLGQWKERGLGDIKLLQDPESLKMRILMRREQVLKVCANHYITNDMELSPHPNSDRSWIWCTPADISEGDPCPENLAVKFKTVEIAEQFKVAFEKYKNMSADSSNKEVRVDDINEAENNQKNIREVDSEKGTGLSIKESEGNQDGVSVEVLSKSHDDDVVFVWERRPTADQLARAMKFQLPATFYLYEDRPPAPWCQNDSDDDRASKVEVSSTKTAEAENQSQLSQKSSDQSEAQTGSAAEVVDRSTVGVVKMTEKLEGNESQLPPRLPDTEHGNKAASSVPALVFNSRGTSFDSFSDLAAKTKDTFFQFGSNSGAAFAGAGSLVFGGGLQTDNENNTEEVVNSDDIHFEPIVTLPEVENAMTGEEDESIVFSERAKLFRLDRQSGLWKEKGVGTMKLLFNSVTNKGRVVMRRDQVLKVCANHYIMPEMELKPNAGSDRSWVWVAPCDLSEKDTTEQLAIRFKTAEQAQLFKEKFDQLKENSSVVNMNTNNEQAVSENSKSLISNGSKSCDPNISAVLEEVGKGTVS